MWSFHPCGLSADPISFGLTFSSHSLLLMSSNGSTPLLLVADFTIPNDNDAYATFGAEIDLGHGLSIRPGYSLQQGGSAADEALGLSAGGGLAMQRYRIDYAYSSFPDLGDVHRMSLSGSL